MNALGMIETNSIPLGIDAGDAMLKAASVELVAAQPVCAAHAVYLTQMIGHGNITVGAFYRLSAASAGHHRGMPAPVEKQYCLSAVRYRILKLFVELS